MRRVLAVLAVAAPAFVALPPAVASGPAIAFGGGLGFRYSPSDVRIPVGGTVTWTGDFGTHPLRSATFSNDAAPGSDTSYSHDFAAAGVYEFHCFFHQSIGMTGRVVVTNNQPPVAAFTPAGALVDSGTKVTFDASGSSDDSAIASYAWDLDDDGAFDDGTGVTVSRTFTSPVGATTGYTVRLRVTDDNADAVGPESAVVAHDVTVRGAAPPPSDSGGDGGGGTPPPATGGAPGGGSAPPATTPQDLLAPTPVLLARKLVLRHGRIAVRLRADEPGRVTLTLRAKRRRLAGAAGPVGTTARVLKLKPTAAGRKRIRPHRTLHATLAIRVVDAAGNARSLSRPVTVRG